MSRVQITQNTMEHKLGLWDNQQGNKQRCDKTMQVIPRNAANEKRRSTAEQAVVAGTGLF